MTHPADRVERALNLAARGATSTEIGRQVQVPASTIRGWIAGRTPEPTDDAGAPCSGCDLHLELREPVFSAYSYALGLYLGDGSIATHRRGVLRLTVSLDRRYPGIVQECASSISLLMPRNRVRIAHSLTAQLDEVCCYSKHWPCLIPQHGPGPKHSRAIVLTDWQEEIVGRHPWRFLRGLIHSDGCRTENVSIHPGRTYRYPRYQFSNRSAEIHGLFCRYCDQVGVEWRQMNRWTISVARRASVEAMDRYIGRKR